MGGRGTAELGDPGGDWALAAIGGIGPVGGAGERFDYCLHLRPEADKFQQRVHHISDRAIVGVLGVRMVQAMLARRLEQMDVLEERDDATVLGPRLVGPLVDLVGVGADGDEQPDMPGEHASPGGGPDEDDAEEHEVPGALPPIEFREMPRIVMVDDIGTDHQRANQRRGFRAVSILQPMDEAGDEVSEHDDPDGLGADEDERAHF